VQKLRPLKEKKAYDIVAAEKAEKVSEGMTCLERKAGHLLLWACGHQWRVWLRKRGVLGVL